MSGSSDDTGSGFSGGRLTGMARHSARWKAMGSMHAEALTCTYVSRKTGALQHIRRCSKYRSGYRAKQYSNMIFRMSDARSEIDDRKDIQIGISHEQKKPPLPRTSARFPPAYHYLPRILHLCSFIVHPCRWRWPQKPRCLRCSQIPRHPHSLS